MRRSWGPWGLIVLVVIAWGIYAILTRPQRLTTPYGYSYSHQGTKSINGVAGFRRMYELRDWETETLKRLSLAAESLDTIVWFPDAEQVPSRRATQWLDEWLANKPRTLIYVLRGLQSTEPMYWKQAMADAEAEHRMEFRRRQIRTQIVEEASVPGAKPIAGLNSFSNGWFTADFTPRWRTARGFTGDWSQEPLRLPQRMTTRATIRPYDPDTDDQLTAGTFSSDTVDEEEPTDCAFDPLVTSDAGDVVAARVTSDWWPDSQVLVLCTGEPLLNLSLADPINAAFAERLIAASGPPGTVGFLRTDRFGARVQGDSDDELAAGMELLTQWPLSMTTMHVVLLGFVAILALLPIFGRPRRLPPPATGDFGEHVSAVADMLRRSGDADYARQRISEYFVQVRGEDSGPWVLPTAPTANEKPPGETP
ncbi:hypothetical protein Poly24_40240 [Rosistilla carotiformis]|uniref:DUF4350 domain-containing protein n=1 Tax=Rosistilla carotiformis TaxID=2528017 RepID=A0A518JXN5_9BACT|nr:hypothetical protein [Rosistilla carotiformis]QDV70304.1 hypothetical protein Poly24_40240 [Rosistilla carotiformis]